MKKATLCLIFLLQLPFLFPSFADGPGMKTYQAGYYLKALSIWEPVWGRSFPPILKSDVSKGLNTDKYRMITHHLFVDNGFMYCLVLTAIEIETYLFSKKVKMNYSVALSYQTKKRPSF